MVVGRLGYLKRKRAGLGAYDTVKYYVSNTWKIEEESNGAISIS